MQDLSPLLFLFKEVLSSGHTAAVVPAAAQKPHDTHDSTLLVFRFFPVFQRGKTTNTHAERVWQRQGKFISHATPIRTGFYFKVVSLFPLCWKSGENVECCSMCSHLFRLQIEQTYNIFQSFFLLVGLST